MTVKIRFLDPSGQEVGVAMAEDNKSISQIAEKNDIFIPVSCGHGGCAVCSCKIKSGAEFVQIDKIMPPSVLPGRDAEGKWTDVLTCVGGITSEAIKDSEEHEVIVEKLF